MAEGTSRMPVPGAGPLSFWGLDFHVCSPRLGLRRALALLIPRADVGPHGSPSWSLQRAGSALGVDSGEQASCEDFLGPQGLGSTCHREQAGCGLPSMFVEDRLRLRPSPPMQF